MLKNVLKKLSTSHKNDIIMGIVLLLAALCLWFVFTHYFEKDGKNVLVTLDGKTYGEYSLDKDQTIEIKNGDNSNILVIEDGTVHMKEATCSDEVCIHQGSISKTGQSIICLPNKIVVTITGDDDNDYDAIVK